MAKGSSKNPRVAPRNPELAPGVRTLGRTSANAAKARYKFVAKNVGKQKTVKPAFDRQAKRAAEMTSAKFYPADDFNVPLRHTRKVRPTKLRKSIVPGTVVIILAGRFRGRRVVVLKQLQSGLLLVSGPLKINGVPLRRVNQAYVIATATKVDVSKVDVSKIDDAFFARAADASAKSQSIVSEPSAKAPISEARKSAQVAVDKALTAAVKSVESLSGYLSARFTLTKNQKPHLMKF